MHLYYSHATVETDVEVSMRWIGFFESCPKQNVVATNSITQCYNKKLKRMKKFVANVGENMEVPVFTLG